MIKTFYTEYSTYEIDSEKQLVRRITGQRQPTPLQGEDGEWRAYEHMFVVFDGGIGFQWPGTTKATVTSPVRRIVDGLGGVMYNSEEGHDGPSILHL